MTLSEFGKRLKSLYPEYNDMEAQECACVFLAKYPQYTDLVADDPIHRTDALAVLNNPDFESLTLPSRLGIFRSWLEKGRTRRQADVLGERSRVAANAYQTQIYMRCMQLGITPEALNEIAVMRAQTNEAIRLKQAEAAIEIEMAKREADHILDLRRREFALEQELNQKRNEQNSVSQTDEKKPRGVEPDPDPGRPD
jgi:hypothetical protein